MDSIFTIPGTNIPIGLDGIMGLIPVAGDIFGMVISIYFLLVALQLGVPKSIIGRMVFNILVDTLVGSVPFFGDIFDFAWTSNLKNLELIEKNLENPRKRRRFK
jgi:hypothetical protein